jgi:DNA-binding YbaB/EbfC family protein
MLKQAKDIQTRLAQVQEELSQRKLEASSGGGMVTAVVNGRQELLSLRIDPEVVNPNEIEMLQDLIVAAVNQALKLSRETALEEMSQVTGGLTLPGVLPSL